MIKNSIKLLLILFLVNLLTIGAYSKVNTSILMKINDEIITNIDLENEKQFLLMLNPNMNTLSNTQIEKISENSLINRKIKELELIKYFDINNLDMQSIYIENFIKNSSFKNKENLNVRLEEYNVQYSYFKKNIIIDNLWKEFIFDKFRSQIKVDINKLKLQIQNQENNIEELNLSEILFKINSNTTLEKSIDEIFEVINKSGFEAAASIYSISESKNYGGNLGWVKSNQISKKIYSKISNNKSITDPIETDNGFLILKVNDRRKIKEKVDFEKELKKLINIETGKELNKLGFIYFNKVKKRIYISEN
tara:strand:- start:641 stop:1564 length:924 start_codon:yes stop_codon:yes gene_type:complete